LRGRREKARGRGIALEVFPCFIIVIYPHQEQRFVLFEPRGERERGRQKNERKRREKKGDSILQKVFSTFLYGGTGV
jgi:hypothetical protein